MMYLNKAVALSCIPFLILASDLNFNDDLAKIGAEFETLDEPPYIEPGVVSDQQIQEPPSQPAETEEKYYSVVNENLYMNREEDLVDEESGLFGAPSLFPTQNTVLSDSVSQSGVQFAPLEVEGDNVVKRYKKIIKKKGSEGKDWHLHCCVWAKMGECRSNGKWMKTFCQKSCGTPACPANEMDNCEVNEITKCRPHYISTELAKKPVPAIQIANENHEIPIADDDTYSVSGYVIDDEEYIPEGLEGELVGVRNQKRAQL